MQGKLNGLFTSANQLVVSRWNKTDTLVASAGDDTGILIWKPNLIKKDPAVVFD